MTVQYVSEALGGGMAAQTPQHLQQQPAFMSPGAGGSTGSTLQHIQPFKYE